jgi:peptidoglycan/LPS O-acetylase OafA/YrhL
LRFIAAAMIVAGHSKGFFGIPHTWAADVPLFHGVSFFFVLSGFILAYVYPSFRDNAAVQRFWVARFARLWPAHVAAGVLGVVARPHLHAFLLTPMGILDAWLMLLMVHAWVPLELVFVSYNPASWSISAEAFFYLLFPLLIWGWARTWHWKLAVVLGLAGTMVLIGWWIGAPHHSAREAMIVTLDGLIHVSPVTRLVEFVIGMAAALAFRRLPSISSTAAATALECGAIVLVLWAMTFAPSWFQYGPPTRWLGASPGFFLQSTWCAPAFALLILAFAVNKGLLARLLSFAPFVLLGEISYSVYLVHQSLLQMFRGSPVQGWMGYCLFLIVTLALSWAIWRYIETPCRSGIRAAYDRNRSRSGEVRSGALV